MSRTGGRRASTSPDPGGTSGPRGAGIPLAAALFGAGLLALGVAVGEGRGAAAWGPAEGGSEPSLHAGGAGDGPRRPGPEDPDVERAYLDGPPPGHTGGFEEPTCRACHFDRPLDPEGGDARLEGVPDRWEADSVYDVRVVVSHDEMARAGFQLAARWRDGRRAGCSAGDLEPSGGRTQAVAARDTAAGGGGCEVVYVQHTGEGTGPVEGGEARWRVRWRAPGEGAEARGPVVFHVAANAANDDASEFGDWIYAAEARSRPRE